MSKVELSVTGPTQKETSPYMLSANLLKQVPQNTKKQAVSLRSHVKPAGQRKTL